MKINATGKVGVVYTTELGMDIADPYVNYEGWKQISPTERESVTADEVTSTHVKWMSWYTDDELEQRRLRQQPSRQEG